MFTEVYVMGQSTQLGLKTQSPLIDKPLLCNYNIVIV